MITFSEEELPLEEGSCEFSVEVSGVFKYTHTTIPTYEDVRIGLEDKITKLLKDDSLEDVELYINLSYMIWEEEVIDKVLLLLQEESAIYEEFMVQCGGDTNTTIRRGKPELGDDILTDVDSLSKAIRRALLEAHTS